jgi:hypothetical protein
MRRQIEGHFADELAQLDLLDRRATVVAIDLMTSYESFDLLHRDQGLRIKAIADMLNIAIRKSLVAS